MKKGTPKQHSGLQLTADDTAALIAARKTIKARTEAIRRRDMTISEMRDKLSELDKSRSIALVDLSNMRFNFAAFKRESAAQTRNNRRMINVLTVVAGIAIGVAAWVIL